MLVNIPDLDVILGVLASFIGGLGAVVFYNKVRQYLSSKGNNIKILMDRLQYYENLLIDMKIRLDSQEIIQENQEFAQVSIPRTKDQKIEKDTLVIVKEEKPRESMQKIHTENLIDYVLRLITEKPMTSRDIQITVGRTREHTARMLKKMFEEGLVERDINTKPYIYKITDRGLTRMDISMISTAQ